MKKKLYLFIQIDRLHRYNTNLLKTKNYEYANKLTTSTLMT